MKQGSNPRRGRNRGGGKRQSRNSNFDSNGPEGRVRGTAQQVFEKYLTLARDAQSAGDRIASENFFQHAEHYYRIMNADGDNGRNRRRNGEDGHLDEGTPFQPDEVQQDNPNQDNPQHAGHQPGNGSGNGNGAEPEDIAEQAEAREEPEPSQAAPSPEDLPEGEQQQTSEINS